MGDGVWHLRMIADDGNGSYEKVRVGARAILLREGKVLLSHERVSGFWCLPGGGHEGDEALEETCRREVAEEAGVDVLVGKPFAVVDSCYRNYTFRNHFFLCEYCGVRMQQLTPEERERGLQPEWLPLEEAVALFGDPGKHAEDGMFVGCYRRDFTILSRVLECRKGAC